MGEGGRDLDQPFPYQASGAALEATLQDIMSRTGIPIITHGAATGRVRFANPEGTLRDAVEKVSQAAQLAWWFDGSAIHFDADSLYGSRLISLDGVTPESFASDLAFSGLLDDRFAPPRPVDREGSILRVVGPESYLDAVEEFAAKLARPVVENGQQPKSAPKVIYGNSPNVRGSE